MDICIINPWIYDFAAFDMWARPLGLLMIASFLRRHGFRVHFVDCLEDFDPETLSSKRRPKQKPYGTSKYYKEQVPKPAPYLHIQRRYSRYGLPVALVREKLLSIPKPAIVLVGSMMTYWYPGVQEAIRLVKEVFKDVTIVLGGTYTRLCYEHAMKNSGADIILPTTSVRDLLILFHSLHIKGGNPQVYHPYPAYDLLNRKRVVAIKTTQGCPFRCNYCASGFLYPNFQMRPKEDVLAEIMFWASQHQVEDFAFYDDALLMRSDILRLLDGLSDIPYEVRFHTPNALHAKRITKEVAKLIYEARFKTIRLGIETHLMGKERVHDNKLDTHDLEKAMEALYWAGFRPQELGGYLLAGLPKQSSEEVFRAIEYTEAIGLPPYIAEYSPIPHTALWEEAKKVSLYNLEEPLYQNNTIMPCWPGRENEIIAIKSYALKVRQKLIGLG